MTFFSSQLDYLNKKRKERKDYFLLARDDIAKTNINYLRRWSIAGVVLSIIVSLIYARLYSDYGTVLSNLKVVPIFLAFHIISVLYSKKVKKNFIFIQALCISFCFVITFAMIYFSVFFLPYEPENFVTIGFMMLPLLFILHTYQVSIVLFVSEIVFAVLASIYKNPSSYRHDLLSSSVALIFAHFLLMLTSDVIVRDNYAKYRYMILSTKDGLTKLLNKTTFEERVELLLSKNLDEYCAFIILDIDNFKQMNDIYGHYSGDELLEGLGTSLLKIFRSTDLMCRFGGDEFCIFVRNVNNLDSIRKKAKQILEATASLLTDKTDFSPSCSIGAYISSIKDTSYVNLFTKADAALYKAKKAGKSCCEIDTSI